MCDFLKGYTALDLSDLRGQLCGRFLADLGAEVVKIEPPGGDPVRQLGPWADDGRGGRLSLRFAHLNANKKSMVLDLSSERDRSRLRRIVRGVDVLIESFAPGFLHSLGLGFDVLASINPGLVLASITEFGQTGPRAGTAANDLVAFAASGLMYISGDPGLPPCKPPETQAYYFGSLMAALGIVAALYQRERTGSGNWIDVSMQEALATQEHTIRVCANEQKIVRRQGSQHANVAPARIFPCRDGYIYIYVSRRHWEILLEVWKDHPAELDDPEWLVDPFRRARADRVNALVAEFTQRYEKDALTRLLQGHGIPCVPVNRPSDFIDDEHVRARRFFLPVAYPPGTNIRQPAAPFIIQGVRTPVQRAPLPGEHSEDIWDRFGKDGSDERSRTPAAHPAGPPLRGLRILSFDQVLAGPYGMTLLAELGADVIKVESRRGGLDLFRFFGASQDPNLSPRFLEFNRNKRSITINLKTPEGPRIVKELARVCDVVMDNFSSHVMPSLGLDHPALAELKPDIVTLRMPGLGCTGPKNGYATLGTNITAFTGFTYLWNHPGQIDPPVGSQIVFPDYVSGLMAAILIVSGILFRNRTAKGASIDLAQAEAAAYMIGTSLMEALVTEQDPEPVGNGSSAAAPQGCYPCKGDDRWCVIAVETEIQWQALAREIGGDELASDARFQGLENRVRRLGELEERIRSWTRDQEAFHVVGRLQAVGVPSGVVRNGADLIADEHLRSRGFIVEQVNARLGRVVLPGVPLRFATYAEEPRWEFPVLGKHNEEVLGGLLGYEPERIENLTNRGVLE